MPAIIKTTNGAYAGPYPKKDEKGHSPWTETEAKNAAELMNQRAENLGVSVRYEVEVEAEADEK